MPTEANGPSQGRSMVVRASDVRSRAIRWAWVGRLAFGYLTVQTGVEGLGKSVFSVWMIAGLTRGVLPGQLKGQPVDVLIVAGEDGIEDTWKPRLDLAGADTTRVSFLNLNALPVGWNLADGIDALRNAIKETGARIVFIDAALDHMPSPKAGESINSPTFVRGALGPLKRLARDLDLVVLFSMHPPKGRSADFRDLVQASQAFSAIPRVGLLFAYHPDDAHEDGDDRRRVLLRGKGNIGLDPGALEFRVVGRSYQHDDGHVEEREVVVDVAPCRVTLADLAPEKTIGAREPTKTEQAADVMREALADGEWHPAKPILDALSEEGFGGDSVVREARRLAKVQKDKPKGIRDAPWQWRIPRANAEPVTPEDALTPSPPRARRHTPEDAFTSSPLNASSTAKASRRPDLEQDRPPEAKASSPEALRAHAHEAADADLDRAERLYTDHADIAEEAA